MNKKKAIAVIAIIAMFFTMMPVAMFAAETDSTRLAGSSRVETSIKVCEAGWQSADTVILAPADQSNLVDALAAAPLAGQEDAPILVTPKGSLNPTVKAKIKGLGAKKVYLIGAISEAVKIEVAAIGGISVVQLAGSNRISTARAITAELDDPAGTFVVGLDGVADALAVASYAAANNFAIALANGDGSISQADLVGETTYIVGGKTRVKDIPGAKRFAGNNRFLTNAEVAKGLSYNYDNVYVANGITLVDALSVAPLAARNRSFVLLVSTNEVPSIEGITNSSRAIAVGGMAVVPARIIDRVGSGNSQPDAEFEVQALNLLQLTVELDDSDYDKEALEDVSNYDFQGYVNDARRSINVIDAEVDRSIVTLTLEESVDNQSEATLVIDEDLAGKELTYKDIEFLDRKIPEVEDVEVIGKDTVKVIFSEPMTDLDDMEDEFDLEMDSKEYSVDEVVGLDYGYEANITVHGEFDEGNLTVAVGSGLTDHAGFKVEAESFKIEVEEDTDPPEVTGYKDATKKGVTLIFDQDIRIEDDDRDNYYHTNDDNHIDDDIDEDVDLNGNELTLNFTDNPLPEGRGYVYVSSGAVADLWDNENNLLKVRVDIEMDEVAPTVNKVEYDSESNEITVTFSEDMDEDSSEDEDNYTLVDEDGEDVRISSAELDDDEVTLELRDSNPVLGTYKMTIQDVEDIAGNPITKVTFNVKIDDTNPPEFPDSVYYQGSGSDYTFYVEFSEEMAVSGGYSIRDLSKYAIFDESEDRYIDLKSAEENGEIDVDLSLSDGNKSVKIDIDGFDLEPEEDTFIINRVADLRGNYTERFSSSNLEFVSMENKTIKIAADGVFATDRTTIEVEFEESLDVYDIDDFFIEVDGDESEYIIAGLEVEEDNKVILYIDEDTMLPSDLNDSGDILSLATRGGDEDEDYTIESENSYGSKLEAGQSKPIVDKILPGLVEQNDKDTDRPYAGSGENGSDDGVPIVYGVYSEASDFTMVTAEFDETLKAIDEDIISVNDGDNEVLNVLSDGTNRTLIFIVDGELDRRDDIEIAIIRDEAGNYETDFEFEIEYEVEIED